MFARIRNALDNLDTKVTKFFESLTYTPRCVHCLKNDINGKYCLENRKKEITRILCTEPNTLLLMEEYDRLRQKNPNGSSFDMTGPVLEILTKAKVLSAGKLQPTESCIAKTCAEILDQIFNTRQVQVNYMEVDGKLWNKRGEDPCIRHDIRFRAA